MERFETKDYQKKLSIIREKIYELIDLEDISSSKRRADDCFELFINKICPADLDTYDKSYLGSLLVTAFLEKKPRSSLEDDDDIVYSLEELAKGRGI